MKNLMLYGMAFLTMGLAGCRATTAAIPAAANFDLDRYLGRWYEAARLPHHFERGMNRVYAEYSRIPGGGIRVLNSGVRDGKRRRITGVARLKSHAAGRGELEVSFFRPFYSPYRVLAVDAGYRTALVCGGTMDYLWILSRTPIPEPKQFAAFLKRARELGFAVERLEYPEPDSPSAPAAP